MPASILRNSLLLLIVAGLVVFYTLKLQDRAPDPTSADSVIGQIDDERIRNADLEPGNWLAYGRSYDEQRFSPLEQINRSNVSRLCLAWVADMRSTRGLRIPATTLTRLFWAA